MRRIAALLALFAALAAPGSASDSLASLQYLVGTWSCTYNAGKVHAKYAAIFAYDLRGNWLRESDSWSGGGSDLGMFTYEPKAHAWTAVVMEPERATVLFRASGSNPNRVVYRSVFPNAGMTDVFQRESPDRYTLHFTQTTGGKTTTSMDVCVKK